MLTNSASRMRASLLGYGRSAQKCLFLRLSSAPAQTGEPISLGKYIQNVRPLLKPPVANRMIYNEELQVMVVGGPNQRKDFHINEGEEIFYQLEGGMELKILEQGRHKTVPIPEGHMFILPSRIPHSPQRFENTIGMVIERLRHKHEHDGLRYFVDESTEVLYEEYFHCKDLGSELVPVINRYFASEAHRTNVPGPDMPVQCPPVSISNAAVAAIPFDWSNFLVDLRSHHSGQKGDGVLVEGALRGEEFNVNIAFGAFSGTLQPSRVGTASNTFLWQIRGSSTVFGAGEATASDATKTLQKGDIHLVLSSEDINVTQCGDDACVIAVTTNAFDK